ncbi:PepSY domain-containing protein [Halopseudomonas pelagia]|uniref:PepSY domain-containing protein n=1 Tax=Halopseudomonas pelagia TaxID=553151 RepID=UPI00048BF4B8|nr:PepSY domain-containing protein [Halopseudomonas pelagia]
MMKKSFSAALATATLLAAGTVMADSPKADWISIEQAIETAKAAGYTEIHKVEADDEYWEGEGMKADGNKYEFKINGQTGTIEKDKKD